MTIDNDKERGYRECTECASGVELLQAGFDVETHVCAVCKKEVADRDEFFGGHKPKTALGEKLCAIRTEYIESGAS